MRLSELLDGLLTLDENNARVEVKRLALDTRELDAQTLFLATQGLHHHALAFLTSQHQYAQVLYQTPYADAQKDWLGFAHLNECVSEIAARFYGRPSEKMTLVGITGTDGKSSLVYLLAQALDCAMMGTIGMGKLQALKPSSHTTIDALALQKQLAQFYAQGIETVALEISSHALTQYRVADVAIKVALFSNLSRDHLDYHASMEDYFLAKASLFARPIAHAVINIDDAYGRRLLDEGRVFAQAKVWAVSSQTPYQVRPERAQHTLWAENIVLHASGLRFDLVLDGVVRKGVESALLARFNVDNLLNVAATLLALGHSLEAVIERLASLRGVPGRVECLPLPNGAKALVDYAHTPAALQGVLTGVRAHVQGRLWVIFGCGGDRDKGKRALMAAAAERFADAVVITDDNPRTEDPMAIVSEIMRGFECPEAVQVVRPRQEAIAFVLARLSPKDAVVIAGKGHENYQIIGQTTFAYSDQAVVRRWCEGQDD